MTLLVGLGEIGSRKQQNFADPLHSQFLHNGGHQQTYKQAPLAQSKWLRWYSERSGVVRMRKLANDATL